MGTCPIRCHTCAQIQRWSSTTLTLPVSFEQTRQVPVDGEWVDAVAKSPAEVTRFGTVGRAIADRLGVSRMTVSNAFSRPDQLSADLRRRILDEAAAQVGVR